MRVRARPVLALPSCGRAPDQRTAMPNPLPLNFRARRSPLLPGPREPRPGSVYATIVVVLRRSPGLTGEQLVERLLEADFGTIESAHTSAGEVSRAWVAGYVDRALLTRCRFIRLASSLPP
jgi:hypothetical protein